MDFSIRNSAPGSNKKDRTSADPALLDSVPLLNASSATDGSCMLGNKYRMPSHRCLFTIIFWKIRRNPGIYKFKCVLFDSFKTFGGNVISVFLCQLEF